MATIFDRYKEKLDRKIEESEGHTATTVPALKKEEVAEGHKGAPFGKKWSDEERAEHQKALAKLLRNR